MKFMINNGMLLYSIKWIDLYLSLEINFEIVLKNQEEAKLGILVM